MPPFFPSLLGLIDSQKLYVFKAYDPVCTLWNIHHNQPINISITSYICHSLFFFFFFFPSVVRTPKIYPLSKFKYIVQYCQLLSHWCNPTLQNLSCMTEALYLIFTSCQTLVTTFLLCVSMILALVPFLLAFYKSELEYSQSTSVFLHVMSILWKNVMCISGTTLTSFFSNLVKFTTDFSSKF